jgi:hypothetical protein
MPIQAACQQLHSLQMWLHASLIGTRLDLPLIADSARSIASLRLAAFHSIFC